MMRRSLTRSLTRSPTPIKYDYDIYKKRSPTFGRRCPVLNRRPRNSVKNEINSRSKSTVVTSTSPVTTMTPTTTSTSTTTTSTTSRQDQQQSIISCSQSTRNNHDTNKLVSSRLSSSINASGSSCKSATSRSISCWDNPSYFQHDDRESQSTGGKNGGTGGGKKMSRKRKPRQSPFRWQHDLFEDDKSPLEKVESRTSQRRKEAKMSKKCSAD
ncbi:uncharacterized protein LOC128393470 [Panonychus citri]|uniref:uncharacterized protein LOC128393470 n=1 Tax=Panonychus citri TaxID=50023 RepID=UPI0023075A1C|nr:uncharacterized protein LOC128393470 [Panonychus citri]